MSNENVRDSNAVDSNAAAFRRLLVVSIATTAFLIGCVSEPEDALVLPLTDSYDLKIAEGWIEFELGHYQDAIGLFNEASEEDPSRSNAYLGLGWCYAMIDELDNSLSNFETAISREPDMPDGYAAEAFVYLAQNQYENAITAAKQAIALGEEEYVFSQIPDVRTRNIRLVMAECYYALGQYADAQAQVDILNPDNNLDQDSRAYEQNLILEIERLRSVGPVLEELSS